MEYILGLITTELNTLVDRPGPHTLRCKRKAITALFPYAVRQGRDTEYPIIDVLLNAVKTAQLAGFWWRRVGPFMDKLFDDTSLVSSKRTLVLASPHMPWGQSGFEIGLARKWAVAVSMDPKEEGIALNVVDTLLQIASAELLPPDLHSDVWSWLTLRPSLPPVCQGRGVGSRSRVVQTVRGLKDIEILKSYLLLIWSEWDYLFDHGYARMQISIRRDFSGVEMSSHRVDLLLRLDHVLAQLDRGLRHFQQEKPGLKEDGLQKRKNQYGRLREILLEVDQEALKVLARASSRLTTHLNYQLTRSYTGIHPVGCLGDGTDRDQDRRCIQRRSKPFPVVKMGLRVG